MGGAVAAAALTAVTLTSVSLAVERPGGEPVFPGLTSAIPEPRPPAPPTPPVVIPPEAAEPAEPAAPDAPDPEPATPEVPVGSTVVFLADYETGDFSQWGTCQSALLNGSCDDLGGGDRTMQVVEAAAPDGGRFAARFSVRDGDVPDFGGGERAEVSENEAGAETREGDERWYEWSMRLPEDFRAPTGGWFIVMQWHGGSGSPPLAIDLSRGGVDVGGDGTDAPRRTIGPLRPGEWVDYVLHVKFSRSADSGFVEAWENGTKTVPRTARATMSSSENYLKQGIYRDEGSADGATEVQFAGLRVTAP
ncbi:MAG: polysaccharide lyase [Pseudonocardia sp.]